MPADALQSDLAQLLKILGMGDHARSQSPHEVFQEALVVLRKRLGMKSLGEEDPSFTRAFDHWSNSDCAAQCRMQAREHLDPELSAFWFELSRRLVSMPEIGR